jgi:hypothetical protein
VQPFQLRGGEGDADLLQGHAVYINTIVDR